MNIHRLTAGRHYMTRTGSFLRLPPEMVGPSERDILVKFEDCDARGESLPLKVTGLLSSLASWDEYLCDPSVEPTATVMGWTDRAVLDAMWWAEAASVLGDREAALRLWAAVKRYTGHGEAS